MVERNEIHYRLRPRRRGGNEIEDDLSRWSTRSKEVVWVTKVERTYHSKGTEEKTRRLRVPSYERKSTSRVKVKREDRGTMINGYNSGRTT